MEKTARPFLYWKKSCDTCRRFKAALEAAGAAFDDREINAAPLSAAEVEGFDLALAHARRLNKPLLAMAQADFPLSDASRAALARAVATTQTGFGMCLVKGFPVDRWSEADTRLAYWGMSLYMGVGRTQNRAAPSRPSAATSPSKLAIKAALTRGAPVWAADAPRSPTAPPPPRRAPPTKTPVARGP